MIAEIFAIDPPKAEADPAPKLKNNWLRKAASGWSDFQGALRERDERDATMKALADLQREVDGARRNIEQLVQNELVVAHLGEPERERRVVMVELMADAPSPSAELH